MRANILLHRSRDRRNMKRGGRSLYLQLFILGNNSSANTRVSFNVVSSIHLYFFYPSNVMKPLFLLLFLLPWRDFFFSRVLSVLTSSSLGGSYNPGEGNNARRIPICRCNLARDIVTFLLMMRRSSQILRNELEHANREML